MAVVCPTDGRCSRRCFFGFARPMWINLRHICANGRLGLRFASVRLINELAVSLTVESLTGPERRPGSWTWASSSKSKNVAQAPLDVRVAATGSRRVQRRNPVKLQTTDGPPFTRWYGAFRRGRSDGRPASAGHDGGRSAGRATCPAGRLSYSNRKTRSSVFFFSETLLFFYNSVVKNKNNLFSSIGVLICHSHSNKRYIETFRWWHFVNFKDVSSKRLRSKSHPY